jgi:hypothetical protein
MQKPHICRKCKGPFFKNGKWKQLYCSDECRKTDLARRYQVRLHTKLSDRITTGLCKYCGRARTDHATLCPDCLIKNKERAWKKLGINEATEAQYLVLLEQQGGTCAICNQPPGKRRLAWDHDHKTGESRGLLCTKCNYGLGVLENFHESPEKWAATMEYMGWD